MGRIIVVFAALLCLPFAVTAQPGPSTGCGSLPCIADSERIGYDNTESGLTATNVKDAIDENAAGGGGGGGFTPNSDPGVDHSGYLAGHTDGANCAAGQAPLGVDEDGVVQGCWTPGGGLGSTYWYDASATQASIEGLIAACDTGDNELGCNIRLPQDSSISLATTLAINGKSGTRIWCQGSKFVWAGSAGQPMVQIGGSVTTHHVEFRDCEFEINAGTNGTTADDAGTGILVTANTGTTNQWTKLSNIVFQGDDDSFLANSSCVTIDGQTNTEQADKVVLDRINCFGVDEGIVLNSTNTLGVVLRESRIIGGDVGLLVTTGAIWAEGNVIGCSASGCTYVELNNGNQNTLKNNHHENLDATHTVFKMNGGASQSSAGISNRKVVIENVHLNGTCTTPCTMQLLDATSMGDLEITGQFTTPATRTDRTIALSFTGGSGDTDTPNLDIRGFDFLDHKVDVTLDLGASGLIGRQLPLDMDGDGDPDFVRVIGDYDGNGSVSVDDIQAAINDLTDTDSQRTVSLAANTYAEASVKDLYASVVLPSKTSLLCDPGAVIQSYDLTDLEALGVGDSHEIVTNDATVTVARNAGGDGAEDFDIYIDGCTLEYDLTCHDLYDTGGPPQTSGSPDGNCDFDGSTTPANGSAYDGSGISRENLRGIQFKNISNFGISNNIVRNTIHSCIYPRSSRDGIISNNTMSNCGGYADDNDTYNFSGIYIFADNSIDAERITVTGNVVDGAGDSGLHSRAQWRCVGGTSDGNACAYTGDDTGNCITNGGACSGTANVIDTTWTGNVVKNAGLGGSFPSLYNATIVGNTFTSLDSDGIVFPTTANLASYYSSSTTGDDASYNVVVSANAIRDAGDRGINIDNGHENIIVQGNTLTNVATGTDYGMLVGVPYKNITIKDNVFDGVGNGSFDAAIGIVNFATPSENSGLVIDGNVARELGTSNDQYFFYSLNTAITDMTLTNNTVSRADASTLSCFHFQQLPISSSRILFHGNDCGNNHSGDLIRRHQDVFSAISGGSFAQVSGNPTSFDCTDLYDTGGPPETSGSPNGLCDDDGVSVVCEPGAVWIDTTGTGSAFYYCRATGSGGAWVNP